MLPRVLLHVLEPPGPVDPAGHNPFRDGALQHVQQPSVRRIDYFSHARLSEPAGVEWLPA